MGKLFYQGETVNKLISSSNDSHQVASQAEEEEWQKGLEMDLFDCQSCSEVRAEEHHLHPEESWGRIPRAVTTPVHTLLSTKPFVLEGSCIFAIRWNRKWLLQDAPARPTLLVLNYSFGFQVILGSCLVWISDSGARCCWKYFIIMSISGCLELLPSLF